MIKAQETEQRGCPDVLKDSEFLGRTAFNLVSSTLVVALISGIHKPVIHAVVTRDFETNASWLYVSAAAARKRTTSARTSVLGATLELKFFFFFEKISSSYTHS